MNAAKEDHTMASGNINRIVHDLPFGAQCPTLQQCLWIKQAPGICVLSCFNVVQCIPTEMKGLPKFIIKVIFTVVPNFLLKSFDVYEGIPSLDHLCPSDWFWVPSEASTNSLTKSCSRTDLYCNELTHPTSSWRKRNWRERLDTSMRSMSVTFTYFQRDD